MSKSTKQEQTPTMGVWETKVNAGDPFSPDSVFTWSAEFREMLGWENEQDFPNVLSSWLDRLHPDHRQATLQALKDHLNDRDGMTVYDIEYLLQRKDGEYRWYRAKGETERDADGIPLRIVGMLEDIHANREAADDTAFRNYALPTGQ